MNPNRIRFSDQGAPTSPIHLRDDPGAKLDAYERQADSIAPELDRYADRSRRAAALWVATLGFGVSRALRRLLARARQPLLGWDLSAAIVCKPQLGASLRKGMVSYDTVVGAAMIVVLMALVQTAGSGPL